VDRKTIMRWEAGTQDPYPMQVPLIRDILDSQDSDLLKISVLQYGSVKGINGIREFLEMLRRQFMEYVANTGLTALLGNVSLALVSSPVVEPEEYLALCSASIGTWWEWLNQGNFSKVSEVLNTNVPIL